MSRQASTRIVAIGVGCQAGVVGNAGMIGNQRGPHSEKYRCSGQSLCHDHAKTGSGAEQLDWKPTRSPQVEAQNEVDDIAQMLEAQNERRRRRGLPDRTEEEIAAEVRRDHADLDERAATFGAREGLPPEG